MKGLSLKNKILIFAVTLITAILCVGISLTERTVKVAHAANPIFEATLSSGHKQKFSAKFEGDVIFSAEKVLMDVDADYTKELTGGNIFYQRTATSAATGEARYFYDYYHFDGTATEDKYVVEDGSFVMLNNLVNSSGSEKKYYYEQNSNLSEVIMISFGNYIYSNNGISDSIDYANQDSKTAGIRDLIVKGYKNTENSDGVKEIEDLPPLRNVGTNVDFLYIIPQVEGNEGWYRFEFTYLNKNGEAGSGAFEFYLIHETSYAEEITKSSNNKYYVQPTLGWVESSSSFPKTATGEYVRYHSGLDGIDVLNKTTSYPTITYDYSRYSFAYRHTANGVVTSYVYTYLPDEDKITYTATIGNKPISSEDNLLRNEANTRKLVTIMLTEPGLYEFEYDYIYTAQPEIEVGLPVQPLDNLYIHGADLVYSKYNYQSAKMRSLIISTNANDEVDLIVPNAFALDETDNKNIEKYKNSSIGFVYTTKNDSTARVGDIVNASTDDTLLNSKLKSTDTITTDTGTGTASDYDYLLDTSYGLLNAKFNNNLTIEQYKNYTLTNLNTVLGTINYYPKTNQGSLWFTRNDELTKESGDNFYFYSTEKFTEKGLFTPVKNEKGEITGYETTKHAFNSETSFNQIGYYLVFLKIQPKGTTDISDTYYQIFAFEYSTSTVNINVREETEITDPDKEKVVGSEKYTRENVIASWREPGVFERKLSAKVYTTTNAEDDINTILNKNNYFNIVNNETLIGEEVGKVNNGDWAKFLIEIKSEGESATYKIFTIDRQNITGVKGYVVAKKYAGKTYYYAYDLDNDGQTKRIDNAITDSYATLNWDKKASGAKVTAKYTITKFEKDNFIEPNFDGDGKWITTNYKLGETDGSYELKEVVNTSYLQSSSVISDQGIYIFTLTDEAGNQCKYVLVIDRTENFFYMDATPYNGVNDGEFFTSGSSVIYSDDVSYNIAEYKAIALTSTNPEINNFFNAVKNDTLADFGYYVGANSNADNLKKIFAYNASTHYLTVENLSVEAYNNYDEKQTNINGITSTIKYNKDDSGTSTINTLYVKGENHRYSSTYKEYNDTKSKIRIEINTDNARGTVSYSSSTMDEPSANNRLDTGKVAGGAHSTNAEYVGFSWNIGVGNYEVSKVTYQFYELSKNYDTNITDDDRNTYFYQKMGNPVTVYDKGAFNTVIGAKNVGNGIGFVPFGNKSSTAEGLYAVTRTYKKELPEGDKDVQTLTYYFIVDRKGVIENGVGEEIKFELLEETPFNDFSSYVARTEYIGEELNKYFPIYLSTSKLPATMYIPTGKYFYGEANQTSGDYYAGQLNFSLYFLDTENQLGDYVDGYPITEALFKGNIEETEDGYYLINLKNNLADYKYKDKFIVSDNDTDWLYLPGVYVLIITDNIEFGENKHYNQKIIGLEILKGTNPTIDISTGYVDDNLIVKRPDNTSLKSNYEVTTSEEFVSLTLPTYKDNETKKAQVDLNYLVVKQYIDGVEQKDYINYQYGENLNSAQHHFINSTDVVVRGGDKTTIQLNTMLRKNDEVDKENLDRELYYLVTVRYKLYGNDRVNEKDKFINCYKYYTANNNYTEQVETYYTTYKIIIDRQAPSNNINNLVYGNANLKIAKDNLVAEYNAQHSAKINQAFNTMFENGYHEVGGGNKYYTMQYSAFYREKEENHRSDLSLLYALKVNSSTAFDSADVAKVLYREIDVNAGFALSMPIIESNYSNAVTELRGKSDFGAVLNTAISNKYYEVVELDKAGNATQYIVYYNDNETLSLTFDVVETNNINAGSVQKDVFGSSSVTNLTVLQIKGNSNVTNEGHFFKIDVLKNGASLDTILTNFATDFDNLSTLIAKTITDNKKGAYTIVLSTALSGEQLVNIGLYANAEENTINAKLLIDEANKRINLYAANYNTDGVPYYATKITITSSGVTNEYEVQLNAAGEVSGYKRTDENTNIILNWTNGEDRTFKIITTDIFGNKDTVSYNTITGFDGFYSVTFAGTGDCYYDRANDIYYAYTDATLKYNTTIVSSFDVKLNGNIINVADFATYGIVLDAVKGTIKFKAPYDVDKNTGDVYNFVVKFYEEGTSGERYNIVLDTDIPAVSLKDFSTYKDRIMKVGVNIAESELNDFVSTSIISGIMNLSWSVPSNEYFIYTYTLRELTTNTETVLTGGYHAIVNGGTYQLVIKVFSLDGLYLGNKVYAFSVAGDNELLYYVNLLGKAIDSNSTFEFNKFTETEKATLIDKFDEGVKIPTSSLPLYIVKEVDGKVPVSVVINEDLVTNKPEDTKGVLPSANYTFYFYQIKTTTRSKFFGILVVKESSTFVSDVKVGGNNVSAINTIFTLVSKNVNTEFKIEAKHSAMNNADYLMSRNNLIVEVYYNSSNEPIKVLDALVEYDEPNYYSNFNYEILGNGYYTFIFKDKAGNVHKFGDNSAIQVTVLREVVVFVNDSAPIENAYYNEAVEMKIYASAQYDIGSISVSAELNGKPYTLTSSQPYMFRDYGNYKVTIKARYTDKSKESYTTYELEKVINFTIINEKEVLSSIDLTNLNSYTISKVENSKGVDITSKFKEIMNFNSYSNAMLIDYDKLSKHSEALGLSTGKQTFAVSYVVNDKDYPTREQTFKFTLNNETPKLDCTLQAGEKTTKDFSISFNAGILYEQIGEAYVMINDEIVATINELSSYDITTITKSFKEHGDGDYYIQLVSTSGNIWVSYKATIKEPLNFWAIVIIIVAVVAVVGVTVTIIVLRNRMRIR